MMTLFTTTLSTTLYILLIGLLGFVTITLLTTIGVIIGDSVSPGLFGAVHINPDAVDLRLPGMAPAMIATILFILAMVAGALLPLIGMLRSTAAGQPFVRANVTRLHVIAAVLATAFVAQILLPLLLPAALVAIVKPMGAGFVFPLLLTLVLAEVFREGVRLREEAEGTI